MKILLSKLRSLVTNPFGVARGLMRRLVYSGTQRLCPICNKTSRRFLKAGVNLREEAECVHCGALERQRLLWLFLTKHTDLFNGTPKQVLHVAPDPCTEPILREALGDGYITADLFDPHAMVRMDICDIHYPDESFDVIYCSHVLEHVADDRKAMREFYRTLTQNGWAIILVPITEVETLEDPSITTPAERENAFGQADHVRAYGPDYIDRLHEAGFSVEVMQASELATTTDIVRMGLTAASGQIFCCRKSTKEIHG